MPSDRFTYWWNRMWCRIDGHQWMPLHGYLYLCIRDGCRAEKNRQARSDMAEFIRSITVHVEVDTNKQTYRLDFDDDDYPAEEMPEVLRNFLDGVLR